MRPSSDAQEGQRRRNFSRIIKSSMFVASAGTYQSIPDFDCPGNCNENKNSGISKGIPDFVLDNIWPRQVGPEEQGLKSCNGHRAKIRALSAAHRWKIRNATPHFNRTKSEP